MTNTSPAAIAYAELKTLIFNSDDVVDLLYAFKDTDTETIESIIDPDNDHGREVTALVMIILEDVDFIGGFND